jgi:hypothetical protein
MRKRPGVQEEIRRDKNPEGIGVPPQASVGSCFGKKVVPFVVKRRRG